jgi:hypothetical protein
MRTNIYNNYYAARIGAEDDVNILKLSIQSGAPSILDTLYFLSPLIDNMTRDEYSKGSNLSKLFLRYQSHPIWLSKSYCNNDSVLFVSSSFAYSTKDSISFIYNGVIRDDSIKGDLITSLYNGRLAEYFIDTVSITFIKSR